MPHALRGRARPEHMEVDSGANSANKIMPLDEFFHWQANLPRYLNPLGPNRPEGEWSKQLQKKQKDWDWFQEYQDKNLNPDSAEYKKVLAHMEHYGLHVRLDIPSLQSEDYKIYKYDVDRTQYTHPDFFITIDPYDKEPSYEYEVWDNDENKFVTEEKNKPLLKIKTIPLDKFIHRIGRDVSDVERTWDYHISLCFF